MKTQSNKIIVRKLDQIIRDIFKIKYGKNPKCFVCGKVMQWCHPINNKRGIQVGHFISRKKTILRWDLKNLYPQCSNCNQLHNIDQDPFNKAIIAKYGIKRIKYLKTKSLNKKILSKLEKLKLLKKLTAKLTNLL